MDQASKQLKNREKPLSIPLKIAFGVGACGETVYLGMFNTFIGIFYNQAIGLSNSLIGLAVMLALIGDAISDPVAGIVSDRWRSRLGRRHPFLFAAPLPIAISLYCIFNPPEQWTAAADSGSAQQTALFLWLLAWTISSRLFMTLYTIPHLALGGELSQNANERSQLFSANAICGYVTGAAFAFAAWGFFLAGETLNADGISIPRHLDPEAYGPLVFTACGVLLTTIWLCAFGTLGQVRYLSVETGAKPRLTVLYMFKEFTAIMRNRNYRFLMLGFFFFMISVGLHETFGVFVNTYVWELSPEQIRWFGVAAIPSVLAGASVAPALMRRFDRRPVLIAALVGMAIFPQLAIDLRLLGWFPSNESPLLLPLLIACVCGTVFATANAVVAVLAMLGDIADENDLKTGRRQEGLIYSARTFFAKASNSAGHFVAGVALDYFVRLPFESAPGQVAPDVIFRLELAAGPLMGLGAIVAIAFYSRYGLTSARHSEIVKAIRRRNQANKPRTDVVVEQAG